MYINGATADPWLKTIKTPNKARTIIIGNNQYFFLSLKNSKNSFIKEIINFNQKSKYIYLPDCPALIIYLVTIIMKE